MRKYNLPIFIPHRGCPHDCVFCNQRKITGVDTEVTPDAVRGLISDFLATIPAKDASVEAAFFGGSFTGLDLALQERFLSVAAEFFPVISGIRLSTRPDYINPEVIALLKRYGVTTVELGVQSTSDRVLEMNNRGHCAEDVRRASELIRGAGIGLGHQVMLGMYGSDPETDLKTVSDIIDMHPGCVRIYPAVTLRDTALERLYEDGSYVPYTVAEAAELAKTAVVRFREAEIDVIRVGLHSSEELDADGVVAGPYHPAFGEIVESLIYRDIIEKEFAAEPVHGAEFVFRCPACDISKAVGHKKMNRDYFREKYGIRLAVKKEQA